MQLTKSSIVEVLLGLALFFLGEAMNMPEWVAWLGLAICVIAIVSVFSTKYDKNIIGKSIAFRGKNLITFTDDNTPSIPRSNIKTYQRVLKINSHQLPNRRPPIIFKITFITCAVIILVFAVLMMYMFATDQTAIKQGMNPILWWTLFIGFFVVFPVWAIIDTLVCEQRQYKLGRSRIAREKTIIYSNNIDIVFDIVTVALAELGYTIINIDKPKLIKAQIRRYIVTITLQGIKQSATKVDILRDSQWITTKFDFRQNKRDIDALEQEITKILNQNNRNKRLPRYNCARVYVGHYSYGYIAFDARNDTYHDAECGYKILKGQLSTKKLKPITVRGAESEGEDTKYYKLDTYVLYPITDEAIVRINNGHRGQTIKLVKSHRKRSTMFKLRL